VHPTKAYLEDMNPTNSWKPGHQPVFVTKQWGREQAKDDERYEAMSQPSIDSGYGLLSDWEKPPRRRRKGFAAIRFLTRALELEMTAI